MLRLRLRQAISLRACVVALLIAWVGASLLIASPGMGRGGGGEHGPGGRGGPGGGKSPGMQRKEVRRELDQSVHQGASCAECHGHDGHKPWKVKAPELGKACGSCHEQAWDDFRDHAHGRAWAEGDPEAPSCVDCHGFHDVRGRLDIMSPTHFAKVSDNCAACHDEAMTDYASGAHGSWWPGIPSADAATCTSCHGPHAAESADVRGSNVSRRNLAMTCGRCHTESLLDFQGSVHARAIEAGNPHAASCTDCHGVHDMLSLDDPASPLDRLTLAGETCASCHESVELTEMHDLEIGVVADFEGSFHGLAIAGGDRSVANCASCHGSHDIRPSTDPVSSINPANLGATCGSCHPGAAAGFASGGVHHLPINWGHRLIDMVRVMYIVLIIMVLGGMGIHNALDFRRRWIDLRTAKQAEPSEGSKPNRPESYLRFTILERVQHWVLAGSFIVLVWSGFALKFGWGMPFVDAGNSETVRAIIHRTAATLFMALAVVHLAYLVLSPRGRSMGRAMLPRLRSGRDVLCAVGCCMRLGPSTTSDWRDLIQMVKYNLGLTRDRPRFGRFSYAEKMEYLALVWGSMVMIATGLVLWFEVPFLNRFPFWGFQLATLVHYFEAILATLAIVIWHFYFTMFNPNVFPLSKAMITGRISRHEMELDHAQELESIKGCDQDGACEQGAASTEAERLPDDDTEPSSAAK